jgi:uncharacterized damage-inducible protein DinB
MQVTELIRYNHIVRGRYFDAMSKLPWAQIVEPKGLSFDSMRNVFLHLTLVEDRWINYVIPAQYNQWVDPNFDSFKNTDSLKKYMQDVKYKTEDYLSKLSLKKVNYSPLTGRASSITTF